MQRSSIAETFGYLVCLIAVVVFFASVAGVTSSVFRVVQPAAMHHPMHVRHDGERLAFGSQGASVAGQPAAAPAGRDAMRARLVAGALDAIRRLVVALVMLILSVAVFRRTFAWLNPIQATTAA